MNAKETSVTHAANLASLWSMSRSPLRLLRQHQPDFSVLGLKSLYCGSHYPSATIKMLPQKPDAIIGPHFQQIAPLGAIHLHTTLTFLLLYN